MANKQNLLIQALLEKNRSLNAAQLANQLGVSVRTVHNYINAVNGEYPGAITSTAEGYHIDPQVARKALSGPPSNIPQTAAERCSYILNRLVKSGTPLNPYDLCDEIYISPTTFHSLLGRMRRLTREYDLTLTVTSETAYLTGNERNKRRLLNGLLYQESASAFTTIDTLQEAFPSIDIGRIRKVVLEVLTAHHYFINDYSLFNLLLHIVIAVNRLENGCVISDPPHTTVQLNGRERELAAEVIAKLEQNFPVKFSAGESYELALLLVSRASALDYQSVTAENISQYIGPACTALVGQLIQAVKELYDIDLEDSEFYVRFSLHIYNLLVRASSHSFCKNPLVEEIRQTCPLIYDVSVQLSGIIREQTGITIDEDEIAYIALHLGGALETQKELASRVPAVLYCPSYYNMDQSLAERIARRLDGKLVLTNVITNENELEHVAPNVLAVCTVRLRRVWDLPIVIISPFLTNTDVIAVNRKVDELNTLARKRRFRENLQTIITPELFECGEDLPNRESAIHHLCSLLQKHGYITPDFESKVLEREAISSTAFGRFAIPHTLKMESPRTGLAVYISHTPIPWGDSAVNLIILMSFNPNERKIFYDVFEPLSMILSDANTLKAALGCRDYRSLIDFLVEHLE